MKKLLSLLPFLLMSILLSSCSEDDAETCDVLENDFKPQQCVDADITVCTGDNTYYIFDGIKYDRDGNLMEGTSNNNSDVSDLILACDPDASAQTAILIQLKLDEVTQRLINEACSAAICQ